MSFDVALYIGICEMPKHKNRVIVLHSLGKSFLIMRECAHFLWKRSQERHELRWSTCKQKTVRFNCLYYRVVHFYLVSMCWQHSHYLKVAFPHRTAGLLTYSGINRAILWKSKQYNLFVGEWNGVLCLSNIRRREFELWPKSKSNGSICVWEIFSSSRWACSKHLPTTLLQLLSNRCGAVFLCSAHQIE